MSTVTTFYSWQSDIDPGIGQRMIRQELKKATTELEALYCDVNFEIDEATRNCAGSPNIPQTVLSKISICDSFVCDLTPVARSDGGKGIANPNVLIELGYAIAKVGWDRIIMLFNTSLGEFPDELPFDIDRQRAMAFKVSSSRDNAGKGELRAGLREAIKLIHEQDPERPGTPVVQTPAERDRARDLREITALLELMPIRQIEAALGDLPGRWDTRLFDYHFGFQSLVDSNLFHLSDKKAQRTLDRLRRAWSSLDGYSAYFHATQAGNLKFEIPPVELSPVRHNAATDAYERLRSDRNTFAKAIKAWVTLIRQSYSEIDLVEVSERALGAYQIEG